MPIFKKNLKINSLSQNTTMELKLSLEIFMKTSYMLAENILRQLAENIIGSHHVKV